MDWKPGGVSDDVEDRRGDGGGGGFGGYGPHLGIGGTIVVLILSLLFHRNLFTLFSGGGGIDTASPDASTEPARARTADANDKQVQFVSFVLDDVQHTWETLLPAQSSKNYRHAKLVLFRDGVQSACGLAQSATGPFYCPGDEKVYLDLSFFDELRSRFRAPGEFAQAYVIAHEVGHHVQKVLGIEGKFHRLQQSNPDEANPLSVKLELQADCFAGVWGHSTEQRKIIDQSDVESALQAAAAVGDDRLQKMATGRVSPETFTHGSSAQRTQWFKRGLNSGQLASCDTFGNAEMGR
ncbi:MAG TPA: neutral zinc metallopeptidase [Bryobacteraceae bacterium]|nr:neutral zinc metallopeptidase [Bryobacteraceae bacterium]